MTRAATETPELFANVSSVEREKLVAHMFVPDAERLQAARHRMSFDVLPDFTVEAPETIRLELRDAGIVGPADLGPIATRTVTLLAACPPAPDPTCVTGFAKGALEGDEKKPGKEKLVALLKNGPALAQGDFGDPLPAGGTAYRLCLYDDPAQLAGSLAVARAGDGCGTKPCWNSLGAAPPDGKEASPTRTRARWPMACRR